MSNKTNSLYTLVKKGTQKLATDWIFVSKKAAEEHRMDAEVAVAIEIIVKGTGEVLTLAEEDVD